MSNRSRRSWYRLSSIVRPTAHSSRDPSSPHNDIEPPLSRTASLSPPPPPKEVGETKLSPVLSPRTSTKIESPKRRSGLAHKVVNSEHPKILDRTGPEFESETKSAVLSSSRSIKNEPPKQQQETSYMDQTRSNNKNKKLMSPPLRPPSPKEFQEAEPTPTKNHELSKHSEEHKTGPKHKQSPTLEEHETTHQKNILTLSEETEVVHGPNETLLLESGDDVLVSPQSVITISGENKGAVMEILNPSSKKTQKTEESKSKNNSNNGENRFVNSNVQIINGSVVYYSSEIHHDPGVHLIIYRKPSSGDGFIIKDHGNGGYTSSIN